MTDESIKPPKVFISYAWEDDVKLWVRAFAKQLRKDGVETVLDQWDTHYGDQLPEFMEKAVRESDFVILVCTPKYKKKSDEREGGVGYEGHIITSEIFQKSNHRKFIPILRKGSWNSAMPSWTAGKLSIDLSGDSYSQKNYQNLLRVLHDKWYTPPPIGRPPDFPFEEDDDPKKLKPTPRKRPQFNIDPKIALRVFLGIAVLLGIILGAPRLAIYFSEIEFLMLFPTSTSTFTETFTPSPPNITFTPALPTKTNKPSFSPTLQFTVTPLSAEITDAMGVRMHLVSAGTFTMGDGSNNAKPAHNVYLASYYMDVYEVTNAAYKICVDDGICKSPNDKKQYSDLEYAERPVVYVNWNMAKTYCEWRDVRLPTEAEWEKSALGTNRRSYPWGNDISCDKANYYVCNIGITAVGSYESGKSPYGLYDMAGNVWEWVSSLYKPYPYDANDGREDMSSSGGRVLRGGSWINDFDYGARSAYRNEFLPDFFNGFVGFRCARSS